MQLLFNVKLNVKKYNIYVVNNVNKIFKLTCVY